MVDIVLKQASDLLFRGFVVGGGSEGQLGIERRIHGIERDMDFDVGIEARKQTRGEIIAGRDRPLLCVGIDPHFIVLRMVIQWEQLFLFQPFSEILPIWVSSTPPFKVNSLVPEDQSCQEWGVILSNKDPFSLKGERMLCLLKMTVWFNW